MHRRGQRQRRQPFAHEQRQVRAVARRRNQSDFDRRGRAALVQQRQRETLHAAVARREKTRELIDQAFGGEQQRFAVRGRRGEFEFGVEPRGRR